MRKGQLLAVIASTSLSEQRSELLTAQRRRDAARTTYEREHKLWQEGISAEQDYLQAQAALHEADIALQNARQKLVAVGAGGHVDEGGAHQPLRDSRAVRPAPSSRSTWRSERP